MGFKGPQKRGKKTFFPLHVFFSSPFLLDRMSKMCALLPWEKICVSFTDCLCAHYVHTWYHMLAFFSFARMRQNGKKVARRIMMIYVVRDRLCVTLYKSIKWRKYKNPVSGRNSVYFFFLVKIIHRSSPVIVPIILFIFRFSCHLSIASAPTLEPIEFILATDKSDVCTCEKWAHFAYKIFLLFFWLTHSYNFSIGIDFRNTFQVKSTLCSQFFRHARL